MSQIVALEDRIKDRFQQLWDFLMDFATFMLDAVIPFWRNYGKAIGMDVQDFLIVPLYRNEFTGEAKRYPITRLPRRSLRHWATLTAIFVGTVLAFYHQILGAWGCMKRYHIPLDAAPAFWVVTLPLYWSFVGAQILFAFVEGFSVFLQLLVILWWLAWWARLAT
jgi:hypothetical protein